MSSTVTATTGSRPVVVTEHYDEEIERVAGLGATKVTETVLPAVRWTTFHNSANSSHHYIITMQRNPE